MENILIVDDVNLNVRILEDHLKDSYSILKASNGAEAIEVAKREKPDLILMDIIMPVMDGVEATSHLKKDPETKHIPVIFITALDQIHDIKRGFEAGGIDYIVKPYNPQEVMLRVNTQINLIKYQKQIVELERKNSVLAMVVTANHELRQPLTRLKGFFDLFLMEIEPYKEDIPFKNIDKMNKAIDEIIHILDKYQTNSDFDITSYLVDNDYKMDIKMVKFKNQVKKGKV
ncbi:MAG TPA: response regulator [Candidatus Cloacimonadota bacterium]|jgi:CheY-like chemotaxis protein|nr:response regulator [Candidatus Cloacimonadota bacterium]HOD53553.1 response regulator [Candidatus Cloacimonadota bacterium]